ncbi:MAG: hypothetical protein HZC25_10455 [Rhodospirillales bacterium]|nr:hypothetical protein [Rhodospirillales bacterium]
MPIERYAPRPIPLVEAVPFASAEEAWLWYCQCQIARNDGARIESQMGDYPRPCTPDDIYRAVDRLYRFRLIDRPHLIILADYGSRLAVPSPAQADQVKASILWDEALDRLTTLLRAKGIVL